MCMYSTCSNNYLRQFAESTHTARETELSWLTVSRAAPFMPRSWLKLEPLGAGALSGDGDLTKTNTQIEQNVIGSPNTRKKQTKWPSLASISAARMRNLRPEKNRLVSVRDGYDLENEGIRLGFSGLTGVRKRRRLRMQKELAVWRYEGRKASESESHFDEAKGIDYREWE